MKRIIFFIIVFINIFFISYGQDTSRYSKILFFDGIEAEGGYGFIMPHHKYMFYLLGGHIPSFTLQFTKKLNGYKYWHKLYKYPDMGLGLYYADLANPQWLGRVYAIFGKMKMQVIHFRHFYYDLNAGIAYLTKVFDYQNNYYNTVIGTHINFFFKSGFNYYFSLSNNIDMYMNMHLVHYSNGNFREPNAGFNVISIGTGIRYNYKTPTIQPSPSLPKLKKNNMEILFAGGVKGIPQDVFNSYSVFTSSVNYLRKFDYCNSINVGTDLIIDNSIKYFYLFKGLSYEVKDKYKAGFHIGYEPFWGNTSITIQWGVYIYDPTHLRGIFYHRAGIKYRMNHFIVSTSIVSHFFSAYVLEWKVGYSL